MLNKTHVTNYCIHRMGTLQEQRGRNRGGGTMVGNTDMFGWVLHHERLIQGPMVNYGAGTRLGSCDGFGHGICFIRESTGAQ